MYSFLPPMPYPSRRLLCIFWGVRSYSTRKRRHPVHSVRPVWQESGEYIWSSVLVPHVRRLHGDAECEGCRDRRQDNNDLFTVTARSVSSQLREKCDRPISLNLETVYFSIWTKFVDIIEANYAKFMSGWVCSSLQWRFFSLYNLYTDTQHLITLYT